MADSSLQLPREPGDRVAVRWNEIREAARALVHFATLFALTALLLLLRLLPLILRALAMLAWIVGMALAFQSAHDLFALLADGTSALMAGVGAAALCLALPIAFLAFEQDRRDLVWGGFGLSGVVGLALAGGMVMAAAHPRMVSRDQFSAGRPGRYTARIHRTQGEEDP